MTQETVADLIKQLIEACDGRDPSDVQVVTKVFDGNSYDILEMLPYVDTRGGNAFPFQVVIGA